MGDMRFFGAAVAGLMALPLAIWGAIALWPPPKMAYVETYFQVGDFSRSRCYEVSAHEYFGFRFFRQVSRYPANRCPVQSLYHLVSGCDWLQMPGACDDQLEEHLKFQYLDAQWDSFRPKEKWPPY